jgi:hypothetical protein
MCANCEYVDHFTRFEVPVMRKKAKLYNNHLQDAEEGPHPGQALFDSNEPERITQDGYLREAGFHVFGRPNVGESLWIRRESGQWRHYGRELALKVADLEFLKSLPGSGTDASPTAGIGAA